MAEVFLKDIVANFKKIKLLFVGNVIGLSLTTLPQSLDVDCTSPEVYIIIIMMMMMETKLVYNDGVSLYCAGNPLAVIQHINHFGQRKPSSCVSFR